MRDAHFIMLTLVIATLVHTLLTMGELMSTERSGVEGGERGGEVSVWHACEEVVLAAKTATLEADPLVAVCAMLLATPLEETSEEVNNIVTGNLTISAVLGAMRDPNAPPLSFPGPPRNLRRFLRPPLPTLPHRPTLIFVASSGRTGTRALSVLLSAALATTNTTDTARGGAAGACLHEGHPLLAHTALRLPLILSYGSRAAMKLPPIAASLARCTGEPCFYCETSNYFVKSWLDVALDTWAATSEAPADVRILILRRPLRHVLRSMVDLHWFGGLGTITGPFLYSVHSPLALLSPPPRSTSDRDLDLPSKAISMLFDVVARQEALRAEVREGGRWPGARLHSLDWAAVEAGGATRERALDDLAAFLGIQIDEAARRTLDARSNSRSNLKAKPEARLSTDEAEQLLRTALRDDYAHLPTTLRQIIDDLI
jgi:hypothetical protein